MRDNPQSIILHVGAHKTATTHLQNSLAESAQALAASGVMFYGPRSFRWGQPTLQKRFDIGNRPQDAKPLSDRGALDGLMQHGHRLILSEENFAGTLLNSFGKLRRPLYPDLPRRLEMLADRTMPLDIVMGIRDPASLLNSAFCQLLQAERPMSARDFLTKNTLDRVDWVDLMRRILAVPGVRTLTVWQHEDYGPLFKQITRRFIGPGAPAIRPLPGRMHEGLSAKAVAAVTSRRNMSVQDAIARFPKGPDAPGYDAYDAADHALSAEYYASQLAQLDAMPRLIRLRPT